MNPLDAEGVDFVQWARQAAISISSVDLAASSADLRAASALFSEAAVIGLSEASHGLVEPLEFRNRLLKFLVEEVGYTAIAIESGLVEGRTLHEFVRGNSGDVDSALKEGVSWTFDGYPLNRTMVKWLHARNLSFPGSRPINYYGFDVSGSPGNPLASRGPDTALVEVLRYLADVQPEIGEVFARRLRPLMRNLRFDFCRAPESPGYDQLSAAQRAALTATIADIVTLFERSEIRFVAASTQDAYKWMYRAAIGARQVDSWLRQIPLDWKPTIPPISFPSETTAFFSAASDVRDRAQADNVQWILEQEGARARILLFMHRYHLAGVPVRPNWSGGVEQMVMGTYLRQRLGRGLVTICTLLGCDADPVVGAERSLATLASEIGPDIFLLDLRAAPERVRRWLFKAHSLGHRAESFSTPIGKAFDILLFLRSGTPVRAAADASD